jgi:hypothetical protein
VANQLTDTGREGFLVASYGWKAGSVPATWTPYIVGSMGNTLNSIVFLSDITSAVWRARGTYLVEQDDRVRDRRRRRHHRRGGRLVRLRDRALHRARERDERVEHVARRRVIDTATGLAVPAERRRHPDRWDNGANRIFKL